MLRFLDWLWNRLYWAYRSLRWGFPLSKLRINWDSTEPEEHSHVLHIAKSWEFLRPFFASHGLILYYHLPKSRDFSPMPTPKPADPKEVDHPYGRRFYNTDKESLFTFNSMRVIAARDAMGRDLVVKYASLKAHADFILWGTRVVSDGTRSHEFEALQYLSSDALRSDPRNHTIPVFKFLTFEGLVFVVMPRWSNAYDPAFENVEQVIYFIDSFLEGLDFMHEHRIYHGDILEQNCGMNIIEIDCKLGLPGRRDMDITRYAFFDFETARICPRDMALEEAPEIYRYYREPPEYIPTLGEFNPFAFDVLRLGGSLQFQLQKHIENLLPEIGLFFEQMVEKDESKRLTARQALANFRAISSCLTSDELAQKVLPA